MAKQNEAIKSLDDLPAILKADHIIQATGLSRPVVYSLMNSEGFPTIKVGKRLMVPKAAFEKWLEQNAGA